MMRLNSARDSSDSCATVARQIVEPQVASSSLEDSSASTARRIASSRLDA